MKHIVHVSNDFAPLTSGISTHLKNLLPSLSQNDFQMTLLVPTGSDNIGKEIASDDSRSYKMIRTYHRSTENRFLKLLYLTQSTKNGLQWIGEKLGRIDLIHQHDQRATRLGATNFALKNNIPIIWTNHSADYFGRSEWIARWLPKITNLKPDGIIAVHREMANHFHRSRYSDLLIRYIPNGVDLELFSSQKGQPVKDEIVVLYPQRMVPMKGAAILAKAAIEIFMKQSEMAFSFHFAGSGLSSNRDKSTIEYVKQILKEYDDGRRVKFLGNPSYEKMSGHYHKADIVVLPLQVETENISVFEAWASGTPLITTQQVEKNGYMKPEENCLIVPDKDPEKLADAIIRLSKDLELRDRISKNGRTLVEERFTWNRTAEETAQFYGKILNGGKR